MSITLPEGAPAEVVTHALRRDLGFFLSDGGPGQLIESAPTTEIFSRPQDKRTEDYVTGRFG